MNPVAPIVSAAPPAGIRPAASGFDRHLAEAARPPAAAASPAAPPAGAPPAPQPKGTALPDADPGASAVSGGRGSPTVDALVEGAVESRRALDAMIDAARGGRTWSPAQLLAVQSAVHRHAARLELAGKVVEQASRSVRTLLETRV